MSLFEWCEWFFWTKGRHPTVTDMRAAGRTEDVLEVRGTRGLHLNKDGEQIRVQPRLYKTMRIDGQDVDLKRARGQDWVDRRVDRIQGKRPGSVVEVTTEPRDS